MAKTKAENVPAKKDTKDAKKKGGQYPSGLSEMAVKYKEECFSSLLKQFSYTNSMEVPRLKKIVINTSLKDAVQDSKVLQIVSDEFSSICGQRPVITRAKKSIANFKLRSGMPIGCMVTLRRRRMYEFLSRLVNIALPRVKDFRGISQTGFDGRGNYTLGLTEQTIFPEINFDKVQKVYGMNITFVTSAKTNEEAKALLSNMGMPFRK